MAGCIRKGFGIVKNLNRTGTVQQAHDFRTFCHGVDDNGFRSVAAHNDKDISAVGLFRPQTHHHAAVDLVYHFAIRGGCHRNCSGCLSLAVLNRLQGNRDGLVCICTDRLQSFAGYGYIGNLRTDSEIQAAPLCDVAGGVFGKLQRDRAGFSTVMGLDHKNIRAVGLSIFHGGIHVLIGHLHLGHTVFVHNNLRRHFTDDRARSSGFLFHAAKILQSLHRFIDLRLRRIHFFRHTKHRFRDLIQPKVCDHRGQLILVCNRIVSAATAAKGMTAADVRAQGQRKLDAHHIAVAHIIVRKAHIGEHAVDAVHPAGAAGVVEFAQYVGVSGHHAS